MIEKHDYEKYFFNDLYDDKEIRDKITSLQTHLYNDILSGKAWFQNNKVINGDIYDLKINEELNRSLGLPANTYSLSLNVNIVPFYEELRFFEKYGYGKLISSMDIIKDKEIFPRNFYFYIDGYYIHDVKIAIWKNRCTIFISESHDLSLSDLDSIIDQAKSDDLWTILLSTKSDYYLTTSARANLFTDNKIYLSKFTESKKYNKPTKSNCWTMYMTASGSSYNLMMATNVVLEEDVDGEYFLVPENFKTMIKEKAGTVKCFIINEPECSGSGIYVNTEGINPVFEIPFKKNPIPSRNLLVWEYDSATNRKLNPLTVVATMHYPNIYDFSEMITEAYFTRLYTSSRQLVVGSDGSVIVFGADKSGSKNYDLYIEWIEPMDDISDYDSYIQEYINCYKNDYASMLVNGELPQLISGYRPIQEFKAGAVDYFRSVYKGDYRAWRLERIIELLQDNPKRFNSFFKNLYYKTKKFNTRSYNQEENPHIYERSILDTKDHCDNAEERYIIFNNQTPHSFIRFYDYHNDEKPVSLYINGILMLPTYEMKYGSTLYVYFPASKVENGETIQLEVEEFDKPIENHEFRFLRSDSVVDLEEFHFKRKVSLSNLMLYNVATGEYIDKEDLNMNAQIAIQTIQYIGTDKVDTIEDLYTEIILADSDESVIEPTDYEYIVLETSEEEHEIVNKDSNRDINIDNISVSIKNISIAKEKLLRNRIGLVTTDFYAQRVFTVDQEYLDTYGNNYIYSNFKGKPSVNRLRVFKNGLRVSQSEYSIEFNGYDKDVIFTFNSLESANYIIQYIGYDEECLYDNSLQSLKKSNDEILYLSDVVSTPFNTLVHRIYIDGYRIPNNEIKVIEGNMIMIKLSNIEHSFTNDSNIMIFGQKHDINPYDYLPSMQFNDHLALSDANFRSYLKSQHI